MEKRAPKKWTELLRVEAGLLVFSISHYGRRQLTRDRLKWYKFIHKSGIGKHVPFQYAYIMQMVYMCYVCCGLQHTGRLVVQVWPRCFGALNIAITTTTSLSPSTNAWMNEPSERACNECIENKLRHSRKWKEWMDASQIKLLTTQRHLISFSLTRFVIFVPQIQFI